MHYKYSSLSKLQRYIKKKLFIKLGSPNRFTTVNMSFSCVKFSSDVGSREIVGTRAKVRALPVCVGMVCIFGEIAPPFFDRGKVAFR